MGFIVSIQLKIHRMNIQIHVFSVRERRIIASVPIVWGFVTLARYEPDVIESTFKWPIRFYFLLIIVIPMDIRLKINSIKAETLFKIFFIEFISFLYLLHQMEGESE